MNRTRYFASIDESYRWYRTCKGKTEIDESQLADNNFLTALYRTLGLNYPKFFKMDDMSKAGILVTELVLRDLPTELDKKQTAVVFFNREASLHTDRRFEETIRDKNNFFPSPSVFVYTLPNIVSGEVCIRHGFQGESGFYVIDDFDKNAMADICGDLLDSHSAVICGYTDFSKGYAYAWAEVYSMDF